jgi:ATP-dependent DNA helicase Q4
MSREAVDGNFVKINLKKNVFVRGKKNMTGGKYRRMEWKRKNAAKDGPSLKKVICYRCKEEGHWARDCTGQTDKLMPSGLMQNGGEDEGDFPSLEQAADMAKGIKTSGTVVTNLYAAAARIEAAENKGDVEMADGVGDEAHEVDVFDDADNEVLLKALTQWEPEDDSEQAEATRKMKPYFNSDNSEEECHRILDETLEKFGYESFRDGQREAILRILRGQSTLVLLATGSGKSLIYQIPAYLYAERERCITIVVSPLVSLMEDQVILQ